MTGEASTGKVPGTRPDGALRSLVREFPPEYFGLVMATGIVALALDLAGAGGLALALTWLNLATYGLLILLVVARLLLYPGRTLRDLVDHVRGPGYFTWVAASGVLGGQAQLLLGSFELARVLWLVAAGLWLLIIYAFFAAVTLRRAKPRLDRAISGSWLLAVVATQAVALLGAQLDGARGWGGAELVFVSLCLFLVGCVLYLLVIGLIFYRFTFLPIHPADLSPPYWINMGALAITTLTGATLLSVTGPEPIWGMVRPFLSGFTLLFWSFGSWWIPLLVVFGVWRHLVARYPLRYAPEYWGLVFPLGMYSVATHQLAQHVGLQAMLDLSLVFAWVAAAAWLITYAAMWLSGFGTRGGARLLGGSRRR